MKRHPGVEAGGYLVKLVRDKIHVILGQPGTVTYRSDLTPEQHVALLRRKLVEEALEYAMDPSLNELAHVYEALRACALIDLKATMGDVGREADRELDLRGGFFDGNGMYAHHPWDEDPPEEEPAPSDDDIEDAERLFGR